MECTHGSGHLIVTFSENFAAANAYRGELLGLMAIHLLLLSVHRIYPALKVSVKINSDFLGALGRVVDLPPNQIPTRCRHSDILKTILVNCSGLPFSCIYEHVKAHPDNFFARCRWDAKQMWDPVSDVIFFALTKIQIVYSRKGCCGGGLK